MGPCSRDNLASIVDLITNDDPFDLVQKEQQVCMHVVEFRAEAVDIFDDLVLERQSDDGRPVTVIDLLSPRRHDEIRRRECNVESVRVNLRRVGNAKD